MPCRMKGPCKKRHQLTTVTNGDQAVLLHVLPYYLVPENPSIHVTSCSLQSEPSTPSGRSSSSSSAHAADSMREGSCETTSVFRPEELLICSLLCGSGMGGRHPSLIGACCRICRNSVHFGAQVKVLGCWVVQGWCRRGLYRHSDCQCPSRCSLMVICSRAK